jgi:hypothetical protein
MTFLPRIQTALRVIDPLMMLPFFLAVEENCGIAVADEVALDFFKNPRIMDVINGDPGMEGRNQA